MPEFLTPTKRFSELVIQLNVTTDHAKSNHLEGNSELLHVEDFGLTSLRYPHSQMAVNLIDASISYRTEGYSDLFGKR